MLAPAGGGIPACPSIPGSHLKFCLPAPTQPMSGHGDAPSTLACFLLYRPRGQAQSTPAHPSTDHGSLPMSTISGIGNTSNPAAAANSNSSASGSSASSGSSGAGDSSSSSADSSGISGTGLLSSIGLGSGLDVTSIINALVNAKKAGPQGQIDSRTQQDKLQISGLTALDTALSSLQGTLDTLTSNTTYNTFDASFSDDSIGSATTLPTAVAGSYDVDVQNLATPQKSLSQSVSTDTAIGAGTLSIAVGDQSVDIDVAAGDTIGDIRDKINQASDNPGVSATLINDGSGNAQLVLTSTKTGQANAFTVQTRDDSSSGLSDLAAGLTTTDATDAHLTIDGVAVSSASNTVNDAVTGVDLNLSATGSSTLTVGQDTDTIDKAVQDFVDSYNSYAQQVATLTSFDPDTQTSGLLLGDSTLSSIQQQISSALSQPVAGNAIGSLAALGITRQADGTLALDQGTLDKALSSNPSAVQDLFAGDHGIATGLDATVSGYTANNGLLQTRIKALNSDQADLAKQQTALDQRMQVYEQQLQKQYTALDSLVSSLNNTSSFLTQQLDALNNNNNN